ncbi:MAG: hypothetical protein A2285_08260 [Elusimicrobia bacterium RIFOXYA12_FULL_57_11]|nr:MAG: hypothetical protein A2285_08260 [Elusimicrobia bacterium RIFOXYA12_FULL_57_11]
MNIKQYFFPALLLLLSGPAMRAAAIAEDGSGLQVVKLEEINSGKAPVVAGRPVPAPGNTLEVAANTPLLEEFYGFFGYKLNGKVRFPYSLERLRFYKLPGWPGYLMIQVEDTSLPEFHNFMVLKTEAGSAMSYQVVYGYDSQADGADYNRNLPAEKICSLDKDCAYWNGLRQLGEAGEKAEAAVWEKFYFEEVKLALGKKTGDHFDSSKFSVLGAGEVGRAKTRVQAVLARTAAGADGKESVRAAMAAAWKMELCGASSSDFIQRLRGETPAEQERMILRCGFYLDTDWIIKSEYDGLLMSRLHEGCLSGTGAEINREYCGVYGSWDKIYRLKTGMEERKLTGGKIGL